MLQPYVLKRGFLLKREHWKRALLQNRKRNCTKRSLFVIIAVAVAKFQTADTSCWGYKQVKLWASRSPPKKEHQGVPQRVPQIACAIAFYLMTMYKQSLTVKNNIRNNSNNGLDIVSPKFDSLTTKLKQFVYIIGSAPLSQSISPTKFHCCPTL